MSKKFFKKFVVIYVFVFAFLMGQLTTWGDVIDESIQPVNEYNFDNDSGNTVINTGSKKTNGSAWGTNHENFVTGYNGEGNARYFNGVDDHFYIYDALTTGKKSIRFKVKKDASTFTGKIELLMSSATEDLTRGTFIAIGTEALNHRSAAYPTLTAEPRTLYIVSYYGSKKINYEIQTPESICDGNWHDILFTWDGTTDTNSVKLYLDDMTTPVAQATAESASEIGSTGTYVGKDTGSQTYHYNGYLDNIQFYNKAITTTSVTPLNLKALGNTSKIDLTWDTVDKATSYTIKRSTTAGGSYTTIATDIAETSYTDTDVTSGTIYYYIVTAVNTGTEITDSNQASAEPIADQTPPTTEAKLKVVLEVAESLRLSVDNDLNVNTQMAWTSSDQTVATVNEKGIVTALAPGNTVVTVKSVDGSYTDYINVLVVENADDYRLAIDLKVGETARLTADDFTNTANVTWAPMDSSIANVTTKGKVTALSKGLVLITAKDADGNIIGRVYVRVRE